MYLRMPLLTTAKPAGRPYKARNTPDKPTPRLSGMSAPLVTPEPERWDKALRPTGYPTRLGSNGDLLGRSRRTRPDGLEVGQGVNLGVWNLDRLDNAASRPSATRDMIFRRYVESKSPPIVRELMLLCGLPTFRLSLVRDLVSPRRADVYAELTLYAGLLVDDELATSDLTCVRRAAKDAHGTGHRRYRALNRIPRP